MGGVLAPFSRPWRRAWFIAVKGGLSPVGEWCIELELIPLVDTRGVAGGVTFIGNGNKDARCLFRRLNPKRPEPPLGVEYGFGGMFSNET